MPDGQETKHRTADRDESHDGRTRPPRQPSRGRKPIRPRARGFPAFKFGGRRKRDDTRELIEFRDTIRGPDGAPLEREWTVYPSVRFGYGGRSTHALLFDLYQIWKDDGFKGNRIHYGTLSRLYQRRQPGMYPNKAIYNQMRRDLTILCDYSFTCEGSFWDASSGTYGSMRGWHLFSGWYEAERTRLGDPQRELPFG